MKVVVGLGNPGPKYARDRHNVGFWCVDRLARRMGAAFRRQKLALVAEGSLAGSPVVLAKPRSFMNLSGQPVRYLADRFRVAPADLLVVFDDMDLPPGTIRIRPRGSSGGHNGMESVIAHLGTQDFPRIRVGIGHPSTGGAVAYVLGRPSPEEAAALDEAVQRAADAIEVILAEGLDSAMNRFN